MFENPFIIDVQVFNMVFYHVVGKGYIMLKSLVFPHHHTAKTDLHTFFGTGFIHLIVVICWLVVFLSQVLIQMLFL